MRFDVTRAERVAVDRDFDDLIVGSGRAGVTLARSLAGQGLLVALMEEGGLERPPEFRDVHAGENVGRD